MGFFKNFFEEKPNPKELAVTRLAEIEASLGGLKKNQEQLTGYLASADSGQRAADANRLDVITGHIEALEEEKRNLQKSLG